MDLENYLHGDCHIFAQALHEVFGYRIQVAMDECDLELEEPVLIHAYCYKGNAIIDARGVSEKSEALEPFDYTFADIQDISPEVIGEWVQQGVLHSPDAGQYEALVAHLKVNKDDFYVKGETEKGENK